MKCANDNIKPMPRWDWTPKHICSLEQIAKKVCDVFKISANDLREGPHVDKVEQARLTYVFVAAHDHHCLGPIGDTFNKCEAPPDLAAILVKSHVITISNPIILSPDDLPVYMAIRSVARSLGIPLPVHEHAKESLDI